MKMKKEISPEILEKSVAQLVRILGKPDRTYKDQILAEFLRKNRAEVLRMCLFEYDQEKHLQQERDDSKEEGRREGMDRVNRLVELLLSQGRQEDLKRSVTDREYQEKLMKEFGI